MGLLPTASPFNRHVMSCEVQSDSELTSSIPTPTPMGATEEYSSNKNSARRKSGSRQFGPLRLNDFSRLTLIANASLHLCTLTPTNTTVTPIGIEANIPLKWQRQERRICSVST
jgi:hypothetical protein